MDSTEPRTAPGTLAEHIQDQLARAAQGALVWKLLALPITLAISAVIISGANASFFSIAARWQIFRYAAMGWVLLHVALAAFMGELEQKVTDDVVGKLRSLKFRPGTKPGQADLLEFGFVMKFLLSSDLNSRRALPEAVKAAITGYYQACGRRCILPYPASLVYYEFAGMILLWGIVITILFFTGDLKGGQGFGGFELAGAHVILVVFYASLYSAQLRMRALYRALLTVLDKPRQAGKRRDQ